MNTLGLVLLAALAVLAGSALLTWLATRAIAATFRAPGQWLEVDGERLHYRSLGAGPAMVLVHGLAGESRNFDYLPLADLARRWRLVLVDRPGCGHSPRSGPAVAPVDAQARLLAGFIRAMQFERPPLFVGHSLGGAIGLSLALQDPACISGLALIAPLTHFNPRVPLPFRTMAIRRPWLRRLFAHTLALPAALLMTPVTLAALFRPHRAPHDFPLRGGGLMSVRPSAFIAASQDLAAVEGALLPQQARHGEIRLPLRILFGEGDRVLDWREQGEALQREVPGAQLRVIPGGHMIPVTAPAGTAAWLEEGARAVLGVL